MNIPIIALIASLALGVTSVALYLLAGGRRRRWMFSFSFLSALAAQLVFSVAFATTANFEIISRGYVYFVLAGVAILAVFLFFQALFGCDADK